MALTAHQLSHSAANVDPDEYLEDARSVAQDVLDRWTAERGPDGARDLTTDDVSVEFPDAVLLDLLNDAGLRDSNQTAQEVLDMLSRLLVRVLSHRPRSGHPDEAASPDKADAQGWARHKARNTELKEKLAEMRTEADAVVEAAGGPVRRGR